MDNRKSIICPDLNTLLLISYGVTRVMLTVDAHYHDTHAFYRKWSGSKSSITYDFATLVHVDQFEFIDSNTIKIWCRDHCESIEQVNNIILEFNKLSGGNDHVN